MRALSELRERCRALFFRAREEQEMEEELRSHVDMETAANIARGMNPMEAQRQALITFGGMQRFREEVRDARGLGFLENVWRDLRFGLRRLVREPRFSVPAVATLALGIGAMTAIFVLVNAILLRPLPYPEADRLVAIQHSAAGFGLPETGQSDGTYLHYRQHGRVFEEMGVYYESSQIITDGDAGERIDVAMVTPSVLSLLGTVPLHGRLFTQADTERDSWVVMISHDLWVRRYGADPAIVGGMIEINNGDGTQVVGIMPPDFNFPSPDTDLWWGMGAEAPDSGLRDMWMMGIGRLRHGVTTEDAEADLQRLIHTLPDAYPDATADLLEEGQLRAVVTSLKNEIIGNTRPALTMLFITAGFVFLIALANVANLLLIRADSRQKEIAVSTSLGAGRLHLARRFFTESLILTVFAGAIGLVIAYAAVELRFGFESGGIPRLHELEFGGAAVLAVSGLTVLGALVLGGISVMRAGRVDLASGLQGSSRGTTAGRSSRYAQRILVAAQIALALTLLIGSALMVQSFQRLNEIELGFEPENLLTFEVILPVIQYLSYQDAAEFHLELLRRIESIPGVEQAGAGGLSGFPLETPSYDTSEPVVTADGDAGFSEVPPIATVTFATAGYFDAMNIPLLRGRTFRDGDLLGDAPPIIISEELSRVLFRGEDPVGRRVRFPENPERPYTVVGVVGSVPGQVLTDGPARTVYTAILGWANQEENPPLPYVPRTVVNVVRTALPPMSLVPSIRQIVQDMDSDVPIVQVQTMEDHVAGSMARTRVTMLLLLISAATALLLGVIGLYGVLAYTVGQRTSELGIRMALGASAEGVMRMVVRQGAILALIGIAVGLLAAFTLTRFLSSLLYEISPNDPVVFASMAALLLAVTLLATFVPARRASRIDPARALRAE